MTSTIGQFKSEALRNRILDINPHADVKIVHDFIRFSNLHTLVNASCNFDVVIDAADSVTDKAAIINACVQNKVPIITCTIYYDMIVAFKFTSFYDINLCNI